MPKKATINQHASSQNDVFENKNPTISLLMRGALFVSMFPITSLLNHCFFACGRFDFPGINRSAIFRICRRVLVFRPSVHAHVSPNPLMSCCSDLGPERTRSFTVWTSHLLCVGKQKPLFHLLSLVVLLVHETCVEPTRRTRRSFAGAHTFGRKKRSGERSEKTLGVSS